MNNNDICAIRNELHNMPEAAHNEVNTANIILKHLKRTNPDRIFNAVGGNGLIAEFIGREEGLSIMFRCEMDAVKVGSQTLHLCGHDGHMAILINLAYQMLVYKEFKGKVYLLFQPAEEVGEGARLMQEDIKKLGLIFDYAFALHNNPLYPLGTIVIHKGAYAAASVGVEIEFSGACSHAAFPEQALNPINIIKKLIEEVESINNNTTDYSDFVLGTIVNIIVGENNYGVTPGNGIFRTTIRAYNEIDLHKYCEALEHVAKIEAEKSGIKYSISYHDAFPITKNDDNANNIVIKCSEQLKISTTFAIEPTRGSDDFAFFTQDSKCAFFDIGNGIGADIHQTGYSFSDQIIPIATNLLKEIILIQKY